MSTPSDDIGIAKEAMVNKAFLTLQNERRDLLDPPIKSFVQVKRHGPIDKAHADFIAEMQNGLTIPIQLKSSVQDDRKFQKMCKKLGLWIGTVVILIEDDLQTVIHKVVECIKTALKTMRRRTDWEKHLRRIRHTGKSQTIRRNWSQTYY